MYSLMSSGLVVVPTRASHCIQVSLTLCSCVRWERTCRRDVQASCLCVRWEGTCRCAGCMFMCEMGGNLQMYRLHVHVWDGRGPEDVQASCLCVCVWDGRWLTNVLDALLPKDFLSNFTYGHLPKQSQTSWRDAEISEELLNSPIAFSVLDINGGILH